MAQGKCNGLRNKSHFLRSSPAPRTPHTNLCVCGGLWVKASSTLRSSRAVPHPSTNRALRRLTSEFGKDPVHSTRYGRWRQTKFWIACGMHSIQTCILHAHSYVNGQVPFVYIYACTQGHLHIAANAIQKYIATLQNIRHRGDSMCHLE